MKEKIKRFATNRSTYLGAAYMLIGAGLMGVGLYAAGARVSSS